MQVKGSSTGNSKTSQKIAADKAAQRKQLQAQKEASTSSKSTASASSSTNHFANSYLDPTLVIPKTVSNAVPTPTATTAQSLQAPYANVPSKITTPTVNTKTYVADTAPKTVSTASTATSNNIIASATEVSTADTNEKIFGENHKGNDLPTEHTLNIEGAIKVFFKNLFGKNDKSTSKTKKWWLNRADEEEEKNDIDVQEAYDGTTALRDVDKKGTTKYQVNTVTGSISKHIYEGLNNGTCVVWYLDDGYDLPEVVSGISDDGYTPNYMTVGRDRLEGVSSTDRYVLWDTTTGKIYKYSVSDNLGTLTRNYRAATKELERQQYDFETAHGEEIKEYETLQKKLNSYQAYIEANPDKLTDSFLDTVSKATERYTALSAVLQDTYDQFYNDYEEFYNNTFLPAQQKYLAGSEDADGMSYTELAQMLELQQNRNKTAEEAEEYRELVAKYAANKDKIIYANQDWLDAVDDNADEALKNIQAYKDATKYKVDVVSDTQVNSFRDVITRTALAVTGNENYSTVKYVEDLKDYADMWKNASKLSMVLSEVNDNLDITSPIKALFVGDDIYKYGNPNNASYTAQFRSITNQEYASMGEFGQTLWRDEETYAKWVAFKAQYGVYGSTPTFQYTDIFSDSEMSGGVMAVSIVRDIFTDPTTWLTLGSKTLIRGASKDAVRKYGDDIVDAIWKDIKCNTDISVRDIRNVTDLADVPIDDLGKVIYRTTELDEKLLDAVQSTMKHWIADGTQDADEYIKLFDASMQRINKTLFSTATERGIANTAKEAVREAASKIAINSTDSIGKQVASETRRIIANMSDSQYNAYKKGVDVVMQQLQSNVNNLFRDGSATQKYLKYLTESTPTLVYTVNSMDKTVDKISMYLMKTSALSPVGYPLVHFSRITVKHFLNTHDLKAAKYVIDAVVSKNKNIMNYLSKSFTFAKEEEVDNIIKSVNDINTIWDKSAVESGMFSAEDIKYLMENTNKAFDGVVSAQFELDLQPLNHILNSSYSTYAEQIDALSKEANTLGFDNVDDMLRHINSMFVNKIAPNSTQARVVYEEFYSNVRKVLAEYHIETAANTEKALKLCKNKLVINASDLVSPAASRNTLNALHSTLKDILTVTGQLEGKVDNTVVKEAYNKVLREIEALQSTKRSVTNITKNTHYKKLLEELSNLTGALDAQVEACSVYANKAVYDAYGCSKIDRYIAHIDEDELYSTTKLYNAVAKGIREEIDKVAVAGDNIDLDAIVKKAMHDEFKDLLFDADGKLRENVLKNIYAIQPDKYTSAKIYILDDAVQNIVSDAINRNSAVNAALHDLANQTQVNQALKKLQDGVQAFISGEKTLDKPVAQEELQSISEDISEIISRGATLDDLKDLADRHAAFADGSYTVLYNYFKEAESVSTFINDCSAINNQTVLFNNLNLAFAHAGTKAEEERAIFDVLAGNKRGTINLNMRNFLETSDERYLHAICDSVKEDAEAYLRQSGDAIDLGRDDWGKFMAAPDTADNVQNIKNFVTKHGLIQKDEEYLDVYFSGAVLNKGSEPYMFSIMVGDEAHTFSCATGDEFMMLDTQAHRLYNQSVSDVEKAWKKAAGKQPAMSKEEFELALENTLHTLNSRATANNKKIRLIGYDCGGATTQLDTTMRKFLRTHGVSGFNPDTILDVNELWKLQHNVPCVTNESMDALFRALVNTVPTIQKGFITNEIIGVTGDIIFDPARGLKSAKNLKGLLENAPTSIKMVLSDYIDATIRTQELMDNKHANIFGKLMFDRYISPEEIKGFIKEAGYKAGHVTDINDWKTTTSFNITRALKNVDRADEYIFSGNAASKKIFNEECVNAWTHSDKLKAILTANYKDSDTLVMYINEFNDITKGIDTQFDSIYNTGLLDTIGLYGMQEAYLIYTNKLLSTGGVDKVTKDVLLSLKLETPAQYYAAMRYIGKKYKQYTPTCAEMMKALKDMHEHYVDIEHLPTADAIHLLDPIAANEFVYNKGSYLTKFNTHTAILNNKYASETALMNRLHNAQLTAIEAGKTAKDLKVLNDTVRAVKEYYGVHTAEDQLTEELFAPIWDCYRKLVNHINAACYLDSELPDIKTIEGAQEIITRAKQAETYMEAITKVNETHNTARVYAALTLSDEDFEKYVVRNCMNCLVIDPKSSCFKDLDNQSLLMRRLLAVDKGVTGLQRTSVKVGDKDLIVLYKDLSKYSNGDIASIYSDVAVPLRDAYFAKFTKGLPEGTSNLTAENWIHKQVATYMNRVTDVMPEAYYGSTLDVVTQDAMDRISSLIPEKSRINTYSLNNWFNEGYCSSLWCDADIQKTFNPYATDKVIDNMGRGMQHIRKRMQNTTNYFNLFDTPNMRIATQMKEVGLELSDWKTVRNQLDHSGYTLAVPTRTKLGSKEYFDITEITIDSEAMLKRAMENGAICVSRSEYGFIKNFANSKNAAKFYEQMHLDNFTAFAYKAQKMYNSTIKSLRKMGMLFMSNFSGGGVRNIWDSSIKATNEIGIDFYKYTHDAIEWHSRYEEIALKISEKTGAMSTEDITNYFASHTDPLLTEDLFLKIDAYEHLTSSGLNETLVGAGREKALAKIKANVLKVTDLSDAQFDIAQDIFERVHAIPDYRVMPGEIKSKHLDEMCEIVDKRLRAKGIYSEEAIKALDNAFYRYTPVNATWADSFKSGHILSPVYRWNQKLFGEAETRTRLSMFLACLDEGMTSAEAEEAIIRTQFDYSQKGVGLTFMEDLMPFCTFKFYNMYYWLNEASKSHIIVSNANRMNKVYNGLNIQSDIADAISAAVAQRTVTSSATYEDNNISDYQGTPSMYAEGFKLTSNHVLKLGNSFYEALDFTAKLMETAQDIAQGEIPDAFSDSVYSPIRNTFGFIQRYKNLHAETDKDFWELFSRDMNVNENIVKRNIKAIKEGRWDDVSETIITKIVEEIPMYGMAYSMALSHIKNFYVNSADLRMISASDDLKQNLAYYMYRGMLDFTGMVIPSLVGATYSSSKQIGFNWSDNTSTNYWIHQINPDTGTYYTVKEAKVKIDNYKATHKYVNGLSSVPYVFTKDPSNYVYYKGILLKMGYSADDIEYYWNDIQEILYSAAGRDTFYGYESNGTYHIDKNLLLRTFEMLLDKGFTLEETLELIKDNKWVDTDTGEIVEVSKLLKDGITTKFLEAYNNIPEYLKYDPDAYATLKEYYSQLGLNTFQAWLAMQIEHPYVEADGSIVMLTAEQAEQKNIETTDAWKAFKSDLPNWYRYDTDAINRAIEYCAVRGMNREQAYDYILSTNLYIDPVTNKALHLSDAEVQRREAENDKEFLSYYNKLPSYMRYESGAFSRTFKFLLSAGYSANAAKTMMLKGTYLTADNRLINCSKMSRPQKMNSYQGIQKLGYNDFTEYFATVPDYLKYEKGAFKRTYDGLIALGFSVTKTLQLIQQGAYLKELDNVVLNTLLSSLQGKINNIDDLMKYYGDRILIINGKAYMLINCSNMQRPGRSYSYYRRYYSYNKSYTRRNYTRRSYTRGSYNKYYASKNYNKNKVKRISRPRNGAKMYRHKSFGSKYFMVNPYVTYGGDRTYSYQNYLQDSGYGYHKLYSIKLGNSPIKQKLSLKSQFPASYRNTVFAYRHSLYKENYAKYGASRMVMRANSAHSYSNASIVRLRRNEIKNRHYRNKREKPL